LSDLVGDAPVWGCSVVAGLGVASPITILPHCYIPCPIEGRLIIAPFRPKAQDC